MKSLVALIVRHGETNLNAGNQFRSWSDVELDKRGLQQADKVAGFLTHFPITRIIASPLIRAVTTANIFAEKAGLPVTQDRGLLPWHIGLFAGRDRDESLDALKLFVQAPDTSIPGGESLNHFQDRAAKFYNEQFSLKQGVPAFFTHTSNISALETLVDPECNKSPEDCDTVEPGGVVAVFATEMWYELEPIFGVPEISDLTS